MRRHGLNSTYTAGCRCLACRQDHIDQVRNSRLLDIVRIWSNRPDWFDRAACTGMDPNVFHPAPSSTALKRKAIAICRQCQVREECLEHFIAEPVGIYGGTLPTERVRLRRAREAAA